MNILRQRSKSISDIYEKPKNMKYVSSDSFLNKILYNKKYLNNNKIRLSKSFTLDNELDIFKSSSNLRIKNIIISDNCKICNCKMNIINNIYHNNYCSYSCYKKSHLDKENNYNINCAKCSKLFKTKNKFTDYCSDECFISVYIK